MYKVFVVNKQGKIELKLSELQAIIDEAREEEKRLAQQERAIFRCPFYANPTAEKARLTTGEAPIMALYSGQTVASNKGDAVVLDTIAQGTCEAIDGIEK